MPFTVDSIIKRTGETVSFDRNKIAVAVYKAGASMGHHDQELANAVTQQVVAAVSATYSNDLPPTVENIQDIVERVLVKSSQPKAAQIAKAYSAYRHERAKIRTLSESAKIDNIPYKLMWNALDWNVEHDCHTIGKLNEIVRSGRLPKLIGAAERCYDAMIEGAAKSVLERRSELRFVIVAGPSSSGKTTTTMKLLERLEAHGVHVIPMSLDNYFFDLELHPKDEFGDYDFETPEALDLALINQHLAEIDAGRPVEMPTYDFKTGKRTGETTRFEPEPGSLVLLDNLHGLYRGLTESVEAEHKFKIYIETVSQLKNNAGQYIRWTDIRLLRRMLRDSQFRAYPPEKTILHWHYVRRSELKHIIPNQGSADFKVNSALPYELPFLKHRLAEYLPDFIERWRGNEKRLDGYIRARRIQDLLESVDGVADDSIVPPTSLLREFLGGSAYEVH
ncbi:MAG: response regulator SirA [Acidobacteria bacterium]|nr:response regulator SirA [Acidobacteriota bacterium]